MPLREPPERQLLRECGAKLDVMCPACAAAEIPGTKFCGNCGTPLTAGATPPQRDSPPGGLHPKHLAEKILTSKAALEGERKQVTVLFADLKGSMELLADRDPEEARKLLDPVLERMMEAVHRYEGTVNQVMGDGIMALFGAPLAHEDHAVRALLRRAADAGERRSATPRRSAAPTGSRADPRRPQLRRGRRRARSAAISAWTTRRSARPRTSRRAWSRWPTRGDPAHRPTRCIWRRASSQVQSLGTDRGQGPDDSGRDLRADRRERRALAAAGRRGARPHHASWAATPRWTTLSPALEQARARHGPGRGRGRRARCGQVTACSASSPTRIAVAGWLIVESRLRVLRQGDAVSAGDRPAQERTSGSTTATTYRGIREKVAGKVLTLDRALGGRVAGVARAPRRPPSTDAAWRGLDPVQRRQRTFDAVEAHAADARARAPAGPAWWWKTFTGSTAETQAFLDAFVDSLPTVPLLLLVNYRPEYARLGQQDRSTRRFGSTRLVAEHRMSSSRRCVGSRSGAPACEGASDRADGGNPFFVEESVRTLVETGALTGTRGAYRPAQPINAMQAPASVQAVLAARIDRLPLDDKRLLQAAAVVRQGRAVCAPSRDLRSRRHGASGWV